MRSCSFFLLVLLFLFLTVVPVLAQDPVTCECTCDVADVVSAVDSASAAIVGSVVSSTHALVDAASLQVGSVVSSTQFISGALSVVVDRLDTVAALSRGLYIVLAACLGLLCALLVVMR